MAFGFELKLYRLLQKYFPVDSAKVFFPKSLFLVQKQFYNSEYLKKKKFDFKSKKGLSFFEEI